MLFSIIHSYKMTELSNDPIINFYCKMISKTQDGNNLPEYSEIYLRLAFKSIFNLSYIIETDILQLYRKLLVLYYCQQYPYISDVYAIMEKCFKKNDLYAIIAAREESFCKWKEYKKSEQINTTNSNTKILNKLKRSTKDEVVFNKELKM